MTSKEAIERIKDDIEIGYLSTKHDNVKDKYNYLDMLKSIEKDLEILACIKDYINKFAVALPIELLEDNEDFKEWLDSE